MMPDSFWECYHIFRAGGCGIFKSLCQAFEVWL